MAKYLAGEVVYINATGSVTVVEDSKGRTVKIRHNDHVAHVQTVFVDNLEIGNIKNPYAVTVYGKGYPGVSTEPSPTGKLAGKYYRVWYGMLKRCYSKPSPLTVWDEWLDYKVFLKWYMAELKLLEVDKVVMADYLNDNGCFIPKSRTEPHVVRFMTQYATHVAQNPELIKSIKSDGAELGYSPCCIESFVRDMLEVRIPYRQERKLNGSGFIPCSTCDSRLTEEELIKTINTNRNPEFKTFKI